MGPFRKLVAWICKPFRRSRPNTVPELERLESAANLPDELLLEIFTLAASGLKTHERGRLGLSIMSLSHKWRTTGFAIMFGPIAAFVTKEDRPRYRSFFRQTRRDPALARTVVRLHVSSNTWSDWDSKASCIPRHLALQHVRFDGNRSEDLLPGLGCQTSVTLRSVAPFVSCSGLGIRTYCRSSTLTSLALICFPFSRNNPSWLLSPEILPSLRSLTMCEVSAQRATRLHTALFSILPQLHTLTVLDWHDWPEDALIHCASLTTLRAGLPCRSTPSPLTHNWPHCLPTTLEALTLITMCKRACHRAACNAVDRTQQLVDMLAREDALLPALQSSWSPGRSER